MRRRARAGLVQTLISSDLTALKLITKRSLAGFKQLIVRIVG
jgi:hypothetical protein